MTALVADQLVAVSPGYIGEFKDLLRPGAPQLGPALSTIFKDPNRGELAKTLTTSLLADYAAKDPDTLTELILAADVVSDKSLFPVLQQHQATAVKNLKAVLDQRLEPDWKDAPLDPTWTEPSPGIRAQIASAHEMITDRFAFCQDMPLPQFLELAKTLRASGYRPTRVRPQSSRHSPSAAASFESTADLADGTRSEPATLVSAIWTRDSIRWHIDPSLKPTDLPAPDAPASKDGLLLADIAPLPLADETTEPQFIALWSEPANADEQCRVLCDLTEAELRAANTAFPEKGFPSRSTISVRTDASGQRRYTAIWSSQEAPSEVRPAYAGFELVEQPQWDVAGAPAAKLPDPLEPFRRQLARIESQPAERLDEPQIRQIRAVAFYQLGNLEAALADLDFLISKEITTINVLQYRTVTLARLGKPDEAKESLTKYMATDAPPSFKLYVQILVPAWLGDFEHAATELEAAVTATGQANDNFDDFNNVVCAAALCSQALSAKDATQSQKLADRTFELLRQMVDQGYTNANQLKSDADFASLHTDPRFMEALSQLEPPATWAGLWRADVEYESKLLATVPHSNLADQLKPFLARGWRPFAIAVDSAGAPSGRMRGCCFFCHCGRSPDRATLFPRPAPPAHPGRKKRIPRPATSHRSHSLTATQRYGQRVAAVPLSTRPTPSQLCPASFGNVWRRSATLFTQLQQESDVSRQRSLIVGPGEFANTKLLSPEQTRSMPADLAKRYADDPDPGIHGAAEWTLRQLGADAAIAEVRTAYSTGNAVGDRR